MILEEMVGEKQDMKVSESRGYPTSDSRTAGFNTRNTMFATGQNTAPILSTSHSHNFVPKVPFYHIPFLLLDFPDIFLITFPLFICLFVYLLHYLFI
jgi:hypothetical protein